jgi:anthranilate synthase component 1
VFQVVLSHRADHEGPASPQDVYRMLRTLNPSPYMYYVQLDGFAVVGSSPETLVKVHERRVETFPIAGSRPRGATVEADNALAEELLRDPKERAEHVMLVDLSRNDLAKVCDPSTVEVVELMAIRRYSHIMHICSTVVGRLRDDVRALDALTATFPAGTLSGAPKPRAIALIDALEPARRGIYGGAIGYFDFAGNMDMAIAIRTALLRDGHAYVQAGAGIVADSVPAAEWAEVRAKAAAAVRAVQRAAMLRPAHEVRESAPL